VVIIGVWIVHLYAAVWVKGRVRAMTRGIYFATMMVEKSGVVVSPGVAESPGSGAKYERRRHRSPTNAQGNAHANRQTIRCGPRPDRSGCLERCSPKPRHDVF
jgi:hypothetical protein